MSLVPFFLDLLQPLHLWMTMPSFIILIVGWVFAPRQTVTSMIVFVVRQSRSSSVSPAAPIVVPAQVEARPPLGGPHASLADKRAMLRGQSIHEEVLSTGLSGPASRKVLKTLFHAVHQAASVRKSN